MKSNPYVYPTIPFGNLRNKKIINDFKKEKVITFEYIKKIVKKIEPPYFKPRGKNKPEEILSLFLDDSFRFGSKFLVNKDKAFWLEKFNYFIEKKQPLQFTILGFPFKMPVSLKTNRTLPDMGEVLVLARLKIIIDIIKKIYKPGACITVFTEGGLGSFVGVNKKDYRKYEKFLQGLLDKLELGNELKIRHLADMENIFSFKKIFIKNLTENKKLFRLKNKEFLNKFNETILALFRIVSSLNYQENILMDVYNDKLIDSRLSKEALKARENIKNRAAKGVLKYFAYLQTRDDLNYLEKIIPHYISMTVSPKRFRLGIIPIDKKNKILPYHGVPVYYARKKIWLLKYLIDLKRMNRKITKVFLAGDEDKKPFYYEIN